MKTEAPGGLTAAQYIDLALDSLDQAGLARHVQRDIARIIRDSLGEVYDGTEAGEMFDACEALLARPR